MLYNKRSVINTLFFTQKNNNSIVPTFSVEEQNLLPLRSASHPTRSADNISYSVLIPGILLLSLCY